MGWAYFQEGEVACASAEVADEDEFVAGKGGLVGVGGGDGFELKVDFGEACLGEGGAEAVSGVGVVFVGLGGDEADGTAHGDGGAGG